MSIIRLGQPGVELSGVHDDINKVLQILPFASEVSQKYLRDMSLQSILFYFFPLAIPYHSLCQ